MVLQVVLEAVNYVLPPKYYVRAFVSAAVLIVTYAFAQGRTTNRERDLHARIILVTVRRYSSTYCNTTEQF